MPGNALLSNRWTDLALQSLDYSVFAENFAVTDRLLSWFVPSLKTTEIQCSENLLKTDWIRNYKNETKVKCLLAYDMNAWTYGWTGSWEYFSNFLWYASMFLIVILKIYGSLYGEYQFRFRLNSWRFQEKSQLNFASMQPVLRRVWITL